MQDINKICYGIVMNSLWSHITWFKLEKLVMNWSYLLIMKILMIFFPPPSFFPFFFFGGGVIINMCIINFKAKSNSTLFNIKKLGWIVGRWVPVSCRPPQSIYLLCNFRQRLKLCFMTRIWCGFLGGIFWYYMFFRVKKIEKKKEEDWDEIWSLVTD